MEEYLDHKYFYYLYKLNLKSIIGNCECDEFDALNGNGCEYKLNEIYAYLSVYGNEKYLSKNDLNELKPLFETAVNTYEKRCMEQFRDYSANINYYDSLIMSWKKED